jgi:chaperone required for assembly of F1-ATPase
MTRGNGSSEHKPETGPMQLAQQKSRPILPRRFYESAAAAEGAEGRHEVRVDGRPVRTPGGGLLAASSRAVAEALAREWDGQGEFIDPATMPLTRLVNAAIDGVAGHMEEVRAEIVRYAGSDLLCYRAEAPAELRRWQDETWSPILDWLHESLGARLTLATGVVHVAQPPDSLAAIDRALAPLDPARLAALHSVTTLTGSPALALAVLRARLTPEGAWAAAHLDEDWQARLWGADHEASQRRERRWLEMKAAGFVLAN